MDFVKMQGLGNDYVFTDTLTGPERDWAALAPRISDRHFGAGSDGIIVIGPGETGDFRMDIWNADGSCAEMCGNGLRCCAKYVYERGLTEKTALVFDTLAGPRSVSLHVENGRVNRVTASMGRPVFSGISPRNGTEAGEFLHAVSMGNPHAVFLCADPERVALDSVGPMLEHDPAFPDRSNVEFVSVSDRSHFRMRVWERGSGETLACGTGACASFAALLRAGLLDEAAEAELRGGNLSLRLRPDGEIEMTGPAETVYTGVWPG